MMISLTAMWTIQLALAPPAVAGGLPVWDFNRVADRQGWEVPQQMTGAVLGGSLWLTPSPLEKDPAVLASLLYQVYGDYAIIPRMRAGERPLEKGPSDSGQLSIAGPADLLIASPARLGLAAPLGTQLAVQIRLINLSPLNTINLRWRTATDPDGHWRFKRCALAADLKQWQEIRCYLDRDLPHVVDRIALGISQNVIRGDIWIDSIAVVAAPPPPQPVQPKIADICCVPRISVPGLRQSDLEAAFRLLNDSVVADTPAHGFPNPYNLASADGRYGDYPWPSADTAGAAAAAAWTNQRFAEEAMLGTAEFQAANPDGRLSGYPWEPFMGQPADNNLRPDTFFDSAFQIAQRSSNREVRETVFKSMRTYLDWWLSATKRDPESGLVTGDLEEALNFGSPLEPNPRFQKRAPIDLNASIVVSAQLTAELAAELDHQAISDFYRGVARNLRSSINRFMWDDESRAYHDYDVGERRRFPAITAAEFFALRGSIAPTERRDQLMADLTDPSKYNWGRGLITNNRVGEVPNDQSMVLPFTIRPLISALREAGRSDLSAELNWAALRAYPRGFHEVFLPLSKKRYGGDRYPITAAGYINGVLSELFGISYIGSAESIVIAPNIPHRLFGKAMRVENILLPNAEGSALTVLIRQTAPTVAYISVNVSGPLPRGRLVVRLPTTDRQVDVKIKRRFKINLR
jgi:hypothetical protein